MLAENGFQTVFWGQYLGDTLLSHLAAAELAKEAQTRRMPIARLAVEKGLITESDARLLFGPDA
jgi:hypothetical protein